MGELALVGDHSTVPLTRVSCNTVFSKSQKTRKVGTLYVVKKILGQIFLKFFSWNLIHIYILNYFYHFQPFSYYKKCAYLKEVIRWDSDQCGLSGPTLIKVSTVFYRFELKTV
mgnify:CR=1 FL=1